ncbi:MAG: glycoside hydrolase family 57 protein [Phycisphaeraceae bacterium]
MATACFYFQVHQPHRLRRYSVFDAHHDYFDTPRNDQILRSVAQKCYLPVTELLLRLVQRHEGRLRLAFSLTGSVIEQMLRLTPEVIERFQALADTGCCEFLAETYYHSLAFLYDREEFLEQVDLHAELIDELFNQAPVVFRNTELIYANDLADYLSTTGRYRGILAEGVDDLLKGRPPSQLYHPPNHDEVTLLLKNYRLSDDIAFRFSDRSWNQWPLTADHYAETLHNIDGQVCNLFIDIETFGEHQWRDTGIFQFLEALPGEVLKRGDQFLTPSEVIDAFPPTEVYDAPRATSWADTERDLSAWVGNAMQSSALQELFKLQEKVKASGDEDILHDWRKLTCSDHFYYMCTKYFSDAEVHKYFNPYESPYDSYINFMNVLDNLRSRLEAVKAK